LNQPSIFLASEETRKQAIHAVVMGFTTDPLVRWFWPKASSYLDTSFNVFDALGGRAIESGTAYVTENYESVALWMPPGVEPDDDRMTPIFQTTVAEAILADVFAVFEAMDSYKPKDPCWYLPLIAVDPFFQGRGFGSQLMKHALSRIDEDRLPAYLESSNPRNIALYERHGFEVMDRIQIGSSPLITPMIRAAR
jgi:GNAT superfamily N-acetyltransferase